ncbi:tyrosine-type recombinase/integrase [Methanospirillum sp.]
MPRKGTRYNNYREYVQHKLDTHQISPVTAGEILSFLQIQDVERGTKPGTLYVMGQFLTTIFVNIQDIRGASESEWLAALSSARDRYSANTLRRVLGILRIFANWIDTPGSKAVHRMKMPPQDRNTLNAADILSEDEIEKIIGALKHPRDRALLMSLYDGGLRPADAIDLNWGHLEMRENVTVANACAKTGIPRFVPLVLAHPYLALWRASYPGDPTGDNPVFISLKSPHPRLSKISIRNIFKKLTKEEHLDKRLWPYLLRHSSVTNKRRQGIPDRVIQKIHWGHLGTRMLATYDHVDDQDTLTAILESRGIEVKQDKRRYRKMEVRECPRCGTSNGPTMLFCSTCGWALTNEAINSVESASSAIERALGAGVEKELVEAITKRVIEEMAKK